MAPLTPEEAAAGSAGDGEQTPPEAAAHEEAAKAQAEAAHQAAAARVVAGPIVWGDRGEAVVIAAKLLARATGTENAVSSGQAADVWSTELAEAVARFQSEHELTVPYRGCVDMATWAALEEAAKSAAGNQEANQ